MEKSEKIQILQDIVKIPSVNNQELEVATYLKGKLEEHGISSEFITYAPNRSSLVATYGGKEGKVLGFSGHMDVVSAGDESQWTYPPFAAQIVDGKMYGRGTTDMKSGLAAMVIAMIELKESQSLSNGMVKLLATVGEEVGELGAQQLTQEGFADDLSALLIGEPTNYAIMYTHMGSINYSVTSYGKEAHSSMPEEGNNAINHLNTFITKVNDEMAKITSEYEDEEVGRTIHNVTVINGGTQVNSIPGKAELQGNIRSITQYPNEKIISLLEKIVSELNTAEDVHLELSIDFNKQPVKAEKSSSLIESIQTVYREKGKGDLPLMGAAATTDLAEFTKSKTSFDCAVFGPGEPTLPHQVDEYVTIENYLDMIELYKKIAVDYLEQ